MGPCKQVAQGPTGASARGLRDSIADQFIKRVEEREVAEKVGGWIGQEGASVQVIRGGTAGESHRFEPS